MRLLGRIHVVSRSVVDDDIVLRNRGAGCDWDGTGEEVSPLSGASYSV